MSFKRNILANYAGRTYSIVATYAFVPFHVSILGVESYGLIAFYSVLFTLCSLADVGFSATFSREAARTAEKHELLDLLATMERILLVSTCIIAFGIFLLSGWLEREWLNDLSGEPEGFAATNLRILALTLPANLLISLYVAGLLGLQSQATANALQALFTTVRSGLVVFVISWIPSLSVFSIWQLISSLIFVAVARSLLLNRLGFRAWSHGIFSFNIIRPLMSYTGGMIAISVISSVNTQLDKLVVSKLFSVAEFGYYTLAGTLSQLPYSTATPLLVAFFPRFNSMVVRNQPAELAALYEVCCAVIALLSSLGAFGLAFFAQDVMTVWLAGATVPTEVAQITVWLACGGLFLSLAATPFYFGLAHGHNRTSMLLGGVTLVVTTPLLIVCTQRLGIIGATIPWGVSNIITFVVLSMVINAKFYPNSLPLWFLKFNAVPVMYGAGTMFIARLLTDAFQSSPFVSCLVAFAIGLVSLSAVFMIFRNRLPYGHYLT